MKKITQFILLLLGLILSDSVVGQNLIVNGDFETGEVAPWDGFKNQVVTDDLTGSLVGNINNGDGSLFQVFTVSEGETYDVNFNYRWVSAGGASMKVRVKDGETGGSDLGTYDLLSEVDTWFEGGFRFTVPTGISTVRLIFYKANGNRPLRIDNVSVELGAVEENLIINGDFETGEVAPWGGFKNQVVTDDLTGSLAGNINNGDGSLFQVFSVTEGETYSVDFKYRWVAAGGADMTVRVKDGETGGSDLGTFKLLTEVDTWHEGGFTFTVPSGITTVRLIFFKANGNRPLRIDDVRVTLGALSSLNDLAEFQFKTHPNPSTDNIFISAKYPIDRIELFNRMGQKVLATELNASEARIDISGINQGVYFMVVSIGGKLGTYTIIKD